MSDIVERLREQAKQYDDPKAVAAFIDPDDLDEAADEIERLRGLLREATFRLKDDDLLARIDAFLCATDSATPLQVKCARCGLDGTSETFMVEEGDEWECPACWERCEAQERAGSTVDEVKP